MLIKYLYWNLIVDEDTNILELIDQWAIHRPAVLQTMIRIEETCEGKIIYLIPLKKAA